MAPSAVQARRRRRIAGDTAQLVIRTVIQQILGLGRGLILPNVLGPLNYGSLATILLVERYSTHVNLGISAATLYQAPRLLASGARAEARSIHDNAVGFTALTGVVAGAGLTIWTWWSRDRLPPELVAGLLVAGFIPPLIALRGPLMIWARVNGDFHAVSRGGVISAVALFTLTIVLGYLWQTVGVVTGHVVAYAVLIVYLARRPGAEFRPTLRPRKIAELLRSSASMTVLSGLMIYLVTVDRITIATHLSVEDVGYYAVGQLLAGVLLLVPNAVGEALGPTLIADSHDASSSAQPLMFRITIALAITVAMAAAAMIAMLPGLVGVAFSRYVPVIPAAQLLCMAAYFEAVGFGAHYVVTSRDTNVYTLYTVLLAAVAYVALPVVGRQGGITAVAAGMVVLTAARTLWLSWMARRSTGAARSQAFREVATLLLIGVAAAAVPLILQAILTAADPGAVPALTGSFGRLAVTLAVLLVLGMLCVPVHLKVTLSALRQAFASANLGSSVSDDNPPAGPPTT